jgi:hypothetical protein
MHPQLTNTVTDILVDHQGFVKEDLLGVASYTTMNKELSVVRAVRY